MREREGEGEERNREGRVVWTPTDFACDKRSGAAFAANACSTWFCLVRSYICIFFSAFGSKVSNVVLNMSLLMILVSSQEREFHSKDCTLNRSTRAIKTTQKSFQFGCVGLLPKWQFL